MNTYKNIEIAEEFNVSSTAVLRWIEGSMKGKNNLQLEKVKNKPKIVKSDHNKAELLRLSKQSTIYKNKILYAEVAPRSEFYNIFKPEQIIELINFLETKRIIPPKLRYLGHGAEIWDEFIKDGLAQGTYTISNKDSVALSEIYEYLEFEVRRYDKVNIVDIGCGNSNPMMETLKKFQDSGKLNKYVAVDISARMLEIAEENISKSFPNLKFESYEMDIETENPAKIFFKDKTNREGENVANIIFFVGGTYGNLINRQRALGNLRTGMGKDDYFVFTNKLDKIRNRSDIGYFNMDLNLWIPKLLNINVETCEIVRRYNEQENRRQIAIKLDKDYSIDFDVLDTKRQLSFVKGEEIVLFLHKMSKMDEIIFDLAQSEFKLEYLSIHDDISKISVVARTNDNLS